MDSLLAKLIPFGGSAFVDDLLEQLYELEGCSSLYSKGLVVYTELGKVRW